MKYPDFGTAACPLRASSLPKLLQCPLRSLLHYLGEFTDSGGAAADTGTLVHRAVEHFHRHKSIKGAVAAMTAAAADFPRGDLDDAEKSFTPYATDPKNAEAEVVASELPVTFEWKGVYFTGTVDQVRRGLTGLEVWDLKTGKRRTGFQELHFASPQLAAYTIGAEKALGERCEPGGIIRSYGYRVRGAAKPSPDGVFWSAPFTRRDCEAVLSGVIELVRMIRRGVVFPSPGDHCDGCQAGSLGGCLGSLLRLGVRK